MIYYYIYMALLIVSLVLWLIIAVREDSGAPPGPDSENK
jgi:hypothetical protein